MWQQGLSPQTWRVWASKILLTNKTPLTETNSRLPIPPNKPTKLSITRWRLVNRGKTPGVSCLLARPACHHQHLRQPSLAASGQDRAPRVPSSRRKTCPPGLQHKDLPVKGLSQILSGTTGQMRT